MKPLDTTLDTSETLQEERKAAMSARLTAAGVTSVSALSPLHGRTVFYDGVPGTICYVHDSEDRFAADLTDGRRPWGVTSHLVDGEKGSLTYTTPEG